MISEASEPEEKHHRRKKSPERGNFSQCGRLCDQTFYLQIPNDHTKNTKIDIEVVKRSPTKPSTSAFTSISREKRGNFRFDIEMRLGQFTHHPDHLFGRQKSPTWSFPKKERYGNDKIEEYQICKKHPLARAQNEQKMYESVSSIKDELKSQIQLNKSSSMCETTDQSKNYSIILPRKTSAVGFFTQTKIKDNFYLTKQEIMNGEEELQRNKNHKNNEPCPKGYIQFYKKVARQPNRNAKLLTNYLYSYQHEKHFNNFSQTTYPIKPNYHIDFKKHLSRPSKVRETAGPNFDKLNINRTKKTFSNIDLGTSKFRDKIRTRYDRVGAEPNTRLDYDKPIPDLGGMITMDKMKPRTKQFFPVIDPYIKKAGYQEMKEVLKKQITVKEINEAMRPKCVNKIEV